MSTLSMKWPELNAGEVEPYASSQIKAEQLRSRDVLSGAADKVGVGEPERLEGNGRREGDDGHGQPSNTQRG